MLPYYMFLHILGVDIAVWMLIGLPLGRVRNITKVNKDIKDAVRTASFLSLLKCIYNSKNDNLY